MELEEELRIEKEREREREAKLLDINHSPAETPLADFFESSQ